MTEKELEIFIIGTIRFFKKVTQVDAEMGLPYVKTEDPVILDYTGLIGISGGRKGCIYFTGPKDMLTEMAEIIMQTDSVPNEAILDIAGEIANTIAGNAQETSVRDFEISVPAVIQGQPKDLKLQVESPTFVIPISWKEKKAFLVVGVN